MSKQIASNIEAIYAGGPQIPSEYGEKIKPSIVDSILGTFDAAFSWLRNKPATATSSPADLYPQPKYITEAKIIQIFIDLKPIQYFSQRSYMEALYLTDRFFQYIVMIDNDDYGSGGRLCIEYYNRMKDNRREILNLLYSITHAMDIGYENAEKLLTEKRDELDVYLNHYLRVAAGRCNQLRAEIRYPPVDEIGAPIGAENIYSTEANDNHFTWY